MEMSGRCNKKRKICHQEDEEDDEAKMEKFFAIIRSVREARDHFMGGGAANGAAELGRSNSGKKSKPDDVDPDPSHHQEDERKRPFEVWKPSFEREDFTGEADRLMMIKNPPAAFMDASGTEKGADDRKEGVGEENLDLKLSL